MHVEQIKKKKMENAMILSRVSDALPTLMRNYTYDEFDRMFHTPSYVTDRAAYYQGARLSDKIAVVFNLADGYCHRFLNAVRIYGSDGQGHTKLLAEKVYPLYCGDYWSERVGREAAERLMARYIQDQCVVLGIPRPAESQALQVASALVGETLLMTEKIGNRLAAGTQPAICG